MRISRRGVVGAIAALLLLATAAACGDSGDDTGSAEEPSSKGSIIVASVNFSESDILANMYKGVLEKAGYDVTFKSQLGAREVVFPALEEGEVDVTPEYVGNALLYKDPDAPNPGDPQAARQQLAELVKDDGISVLELSDAEDGDILVVTKATADKYILVKISDLANSAPGTFVMGGPPECDQRITCAKGLETIYGIRLKQFRPLDVGGPITKGALDKGEIDLARIFSADASIAEKGYVILQDDRFFQPSGKLVPLIRTEKLNDEVAAALNGVSAALTTEELIELNRKVSIDKDDAADVAEEWLQDNGLA
jgi:osmoprotectant transport system substrate-binding protein